jgi:hypothetical protein
MDPPCANQAPADDDDEMEEVGRALEEEDVVGQRIRNTQSRSKVDQLVVRSEPRYVRFLFLFLF